MGHCVEQILMGSKKVWERLVHQHMRILSLQVLNSASVSTDNETLICVIDMTRLDITYIRQVIQSLVGCL